MRWKTFVSNRAVQINKTSRSADWHYEYAIGTSEEEIKSNTLWWDEPFNLKNLKRPDKATFYENIGLPNENKY